MGNDATVVPIVVDESVTDELAELNKQPCKKKSLRESVYEFTSDDKIKKMANKIKK